MRERKSTPLYTGKSNHENANPTIKKRASLELDKVVNRSFLSTNKIGISLNSAFNHFQRRKHRG